MAIILISAYPICLVYLAIFFFYPKIATVLVLLFSILLWFYIIMINRVIKFNDNNFTEREKKLLNKYPIFFKFPFASTTVSAFLAVIQMSTIIMIIILVFKQHWLYLIPIVLVYSIFAILRPKLDPLFFEKEHLSKQKTYSRQMEVKNDIDLMVAVYNKLWGINNI